MSWEQILANITLSTFHSAKESMTTVSLINITLNVTLSSGIVNMRLLRAVTE